MELEDIIYVLTRSGFKNDNQTVTEWGVTRMSLIKSVNGRDFYYWFGPNTDGYFTLSKHATNFVPIRADGNTQIEILISGDFPKEYKEYKRDYKLNELGI